MKKQKLHLMAAVTAAFAAFLLGFFIGRNGGHEAVTVSVPPAMQTEPSETVYSPPPTDPEAVFPVNINSASLEELMTLPGIGEVLAKRIIAYREENGPFETVEALMNVEDIGEKRLEEILDFVTVGG